MRTGNVNAAPSVPRLARVGRLVFKMTGTLCHPSKPSIPEAFCTTSAAYKRRSCFNGLNVPFRSHGNLISKRSSCTDVVDMHSRTMTSSTFRYVRSNIARTLPIKRWPDSVESGLALRRRYVCALRHLGNSQKHDARPAWLLFGSHCDVFVQKSSGLPC